MGGSGAKNKRRLQRQSANNDTDSDQKPTTTSSSSSSSWPKKPMVMSNHRNNKSNPDSKKQQQPPPFQTEKQSKIKKPKHLKRKLQALTTSSTSSTILPNHVSLMVQEKEALQQQLRAWEEIKQKNKKQNCNQYDAIPAAASEHKDKKEPIPMHRSDKSTPTSVVDPFGVTLFPRTDHDVASSFLVQPKAVKQTSHHGVDDHHSKDGISDADHNSKYEKAVEALVRPHGERRRGRTDKTAEIAKVQDDPPKPSRGNETVSDDSDPDDKNNDDDDDNNKAVEASTRQRGKRRRGRKDTAEKVRADQVETTTTTTTTSEHDDGKNQATDSTGTKKRYCQGRKPVTDFIVGHTYPGKVVYVKPFGVFFDIGCHSDAFCHVSRLQDEFVEDAQSLFQPGQVIEHGRIRVIEIDRAQKRITVSLQSAAMREIELESIEARKKRKGKQQQSDKTSLKRKQQQQSLTATLPSTSKRSTSLVNDNQEAVAAKKIKSTTKEEQDSNTTGKKPSPNERPSSSLGSKPESEMTPAELKRHRKLARRAARRGEQQ